MGPYGSSLEMLKSGIFAQYGVEDVSIAGYPEGHPDISDEILARELKGKVEVLEEQDLSGVILTQFGFDIDPVAKWLIELAEQNISIPIRIGVPGPAGLKRLLVYVQ